MSPAYEQLRRKTLFEFGQFVVCFQFVQQWGRSVWTDVQWASQIDSVMIWQTIDRPCRYPITIPASKKPLLSTRPPTTLPQRRRNESQTICKIAPQCRSLRKKENDDVLQCLLEQDVDYHSEKSCQSGLVRLMNVQCSCSELHIKRGKWNVLNIPLYLLKLLSSIDKTARRTWKY